MLDIKKSLAYTATMKRTEHTEAIRNKLREIGRSQTSLARSLKLTESQLSRRLTKKIPMETEHFLEICRLLKLNANNLK